MQFETQVPIQSIRGRVSRRKSGEKKITVTRRKCLGVVNGEPVFGPKEAYFLTPNKGNVSPAVEANRLIQKNALTRMYTEFRDPVMLAAWKEQFIRYSKHPYADEFADIPPRKPANPRPASPWSVRPVVSAPKVYTTLRGFALATIRARMASVGSLE